MSSIASGTHRRTLVFLRYSRLHGVPLTRGVLATLDLRYGRKHGHDHSPATALLDEPTTHARPIPRLPLLAQLAGLLPAERPAVTSASSRRAVPLSRGWSPWLP